MIRSEMKQDTLTLHINGSLTVEAFNEFESGYINQDAKRIILDFAQCAHIDSAGLGMLLQLRERTEKKQQEVILRNLSDEIIKIFEVVKFSKLFTLE